MRVLVASSETQGQRASDFDWAVDGELVGFPWVCDRDDPSRPGYEGPDGGCGCGRAFTGLASGKGTTTAKVVELTMNAADWITIYRQYLDGAWPGLPYAGEIVAGDCRLLMRICRAANVGDVIEKRGDTICVRRAAGR